MSLIGFVTDDFRRMGRDFRSLFSPPPRSTSAEDFIRRFEAREAARPESRDEALKRLGLDRIPCRLTDNDIQGINGEEVTQEKLRRFREFYDQLSAFERDWK